MAFVAALQKLFRDYETLLNAYKPLGTPPSIKNATEKTLDETLVSVTEETKKAAEVELQPAKAAAEVELPPAEEAAEIQLPPADAAAEIQQLPADAAAVVKESAAEIQPPATVVKGEVNAAAEIQPPADAAAVVKEAVKAATVVKQLPTKTATVVELQQSADIISIKNAINNMKSSFPNKPLREPLVNTNLNYGAPLNLKVKSPVQINHSRLMEEIELIHANKLMEERKLKKKNQKKATALWKFHKSYSYNDKLKKYEHNGKYERKEPTKYMKDLEKEKELKKYSESDFETKEYLTNQKIEKAIGIKSCCSNSGMFGQLYDGIPIEICEKKEKLKTYPDSFFNCFVDFFNCIGFSISEKKLRTLVSKAIEKYSFSEEELNELYMEVEVNVDLLGKLMKLEQERMHKLLNGPDLLKYKLSNAITEDFVQVGSAIYPFMNKVLENLKRKDFSKKTLLVRDFDDAEILSDSDRNWLGNSTNKDFSFTIDGKMYRNLEFVVIVGYKQSNYGTIRYVLENNMSSESNDRLVLIQSDGFLYDLGYVKIDGEQVFIMDKTKIFAKTSEKLIKEETLVRKEKEKQLEVVNEKIELLDNNKQENINEIKNINNQNILLNTAISNNYNRNYYKETKNCDTLTIVGFMAKILNNVLQEIEDTATDDDTIDSLEIKFLAIMNEKISKKRSAKYDCRIKNINDKYILITKNTGINTPRVKKHKPLPTNPQPLSPTTKLVLNGFETKILAKIKDFWRRNTQSLVNNIIENENRIIILENLIKDYNNEKNKLIKDKNLIEEELSVLKKSLEEKIDQLQETKSSPAVNTVTLVPQLPEKEKVADVPTTVEIRKQYQLEKKLGNQIDLNKVTMNVQKHVYMPGMFKGL